MTQVIYQIIHAPYLMSMRIAAPVALTWELLYRVCILNIDLPPVLRFYYAIMTAILT